VATNLSDLDLLLREMGEFDKARPYCEEALAMRRRLYPPDRFPDGHDELASSLLRMGSLLNATVGPHEALTYSEQALAMNERLYPPRKYPNGHPRLATSLNQLGVIHRTMQNHEKALDYYKRALAMTERLYPVEKYKDGTRGLMVSLTNVGSVYAELGQLEKALEYMERAVAMAQRLYPPERFPAGHPDLAQNLNRLALVLATMGDHEKALAAYEKALAMRQRLYPPERFPAGHPEVVESLSNVATELHAVGEYRQARRNLEQALAMLDRLSPPEKKPGHPDRVLVLNNLGTMLRDMGEYDKALSCHEQALAIVERLYPPDRYKNGHPELAACLNNLGGLLQAMGEYGKALPYYERALAITDRLYPADFYKDGHPFRAASLNNLAAILRDRKQFDKALEWQVKALAMYDRLYPRDRYKHGHADLVACLITAGTLLEDLGRLPEALELYERAREMSERLYPADRYPDGNPTLAVCYNNVGGVQRKLRQLDKARASYEKVLAMNRRLYPADRYPEGHPALTLSLGNLGNELMDAGQYEEAVPLLKESLQSFARQARRETASAPESQALALLRELPFKGESYLLAALHVPGESAATVYDQLWLTKGWLLDLASRRHQAARADADAPQTRDRWERLVDVRRQLNRLAVEPGKDPAGRQHRLTQLTEEQEQLERALAKALPEVARHKRLASLGPADLHDKLERGTTFIDLFRYRHGEKGEFQGYRYQAFILAPGQSVRRVDLGPAPAIDEAVVSWRRSLDRLEAGRAPAVLKDLVWDKLAEQLPAGTTTIYVCPEGDLARLPWAALPGKKPGAVLLEEVAVAVVPSGRWLLEQLLYPPQAVGGPDTLAAAGAIDYGPAPEQKAAYPPLAETGRELKRVLEAFGATDGLDGTAATPAALRARLPKARYAHLATHGYFDEAGISAEQQRLREQVGKWQFGAERTPSRVGVRQHPLGYVGLALAGANDPGRAADGGILTGLGIIDLPLEELRLCVLSACETGLGELTEGEGVVGLQRAFHVAGCPNVIGSLWKVNDAATAALMAQFYHELRVNKRPPVEALREAQLTIYRHPERIPALAGERGRPALDAAAKLGSATTAKPDEKAKTTPTKLWAAFVLSGLGK
jgi:CHAT domain-containing protein/Tfp pilus assembly protein PilF